MIQQTAPSVKGVPMGEIEWEDTFESRASVWRLFIGRRLDGIVRPGGFPAWRENLRDSNAFLRNRIKPSYNSDCFFWNAWTSWEEIWLSISKEPQSLKRGEGKTIHLLGSGIELNCRVYNLNFVPVDFSVEINPKDTQSLYES